MEANMTNEVENKSERKGRKTKQTKKQNIHFVRLKCLT